MGFGYDARLVSPFTVMREVNASSAETLSLLSNPVEDGRFPDRMLGPAMLDLTNAVCSRSPTGVTARS